MKRKTVPRIVISAALLFNLLTINVSAAIAEDNPKEGEGISPSLYPYEVTVTKDSADVNRRFIVKYYELTIDNSPQDIPQQSFEQDGYHYISSLHNFDRLLN